MNDTPAATTRLDPHAADHPPGEAPPDHDAREARLAGMLRRWWRDERPAWTDPDWWDAPLREDARALLWLPAGPLLATALADLPGGPTCPDPHAGEAPPERPTPGHAPGWPCACMVVRAAAWQACAAWVAAGAAGALVDAAGPRPVRFDVPLIVQQIIDPAREELARALRMSPASMGNRIAAARELIAHPRLAEEVSTAAISEWAARLVALELTGLEQDQAAEVVQQVCDRIDARLASGRRAWTSAEVARVAREVRRRRCGQTDRDLRERAHAQRRVRLHPDSHGMAALVADIDGTDAHRIHRRITALARGLAHPTDPRTSDQIRADVLVDLLLGTPHPGQPQPTVTALATVHDPLPNQTPAPPEIQVVVPLSTLLGCDEHPAELVGLGPIPAQVARELAADGRWRAWLTDAAGAITATGTRGYTPTAALARLIRAREPYCRMPGCRQPATRCDLDHAIPWPHGRTCPENLGPLCRRHHQLKTHAGWHLHPVTNPAPDTDPPAPPTWRWRTPAGFTITDHAPTWNARAGSGVGIALGAGTSPARPSTDPRGPIARAPDGPGGCGP